MSDSDTENPRHRRRNQILALLILLVASCGQPQVGSLEWHPDEYRVEEETENDEENEEEEDQEYTWEAATRDDCEKRLDCFCWDFD